MINICCMCESAIYPGHGSLLIKNDMRSLWFCRSKCKKNFGKKKNPIFLHWTQLNRKKRGVLLNRKVFYTPFTYKKIEKTKEYDQYAVIYVLYEFARLKQLNFNRSVDYKYFKKDSK
nr:60S ribosomal protein L24 [Cryptomonas curvata]